MSIKYICEKHGKLGKTQRLMWAIENNGKRWCVQCFSEVMDNLCGKLIEVEGDDKLD